ncbi:MAG TPA: flagellar hook-length control protein FliK [Gaiellaceae bacterium]
MKRAAALLSLLAALAVLAGGCGAAATTDSAASDPVALAASRTASAGSSRVELAMTMRAAGQSFDAKGSGAFDYGSPRGFLTFDMNVPELGPLRMEMRLVDKKVYLHLPAAARQEAPNGKDWLGVDLEQSLQSQGLGALDFTRQQDPAQLLEYLRTAGDGVTEAGYDEVRGVPVTKYTGKLNLRKALDAGLEQLGGSDAAREQARQGLEDMLDQLGPLGMPFEVYIGEDGLLRRIALTMSMPIEGQSVELSVQMDYFDFGVPVVVEAPPAASVYDVTKLATP